MPTRLSNLILSVSLCLATLTLVACAGGNSRTSSVAVAQQRLGGSWRLQSFAPIVSLDQPLQAVLGAEIGKLTVTFNQAQFNAVGSGVNLKGRYDVTSAAGEQISLVLSDPENVGFHFTAQFAGNLLHFQSNDKPWVGVGALERSPI